MTNGTFIKRIVRDKRGATAVEYGLIVSLIVVAIIVAIGEVATETNKMWSNVSAKSASAMSGS